MPIYEYECSRCGEKFQLRRSAGDSDHEIMCPKCGVEHPRRVFSLFASSPSGEGNACGPTRPT